MSDATRGADGSVCGECGSLNQADASFCGVCGAYLDWDGRPAPTEPPQEPPALPEAVRREPEKRTLIDRVKAGLGFDDDEADGAAGRHEVAGPDAPITGVPGERIPETHPAAGPADAHIAEREPTAQPTTKTAPPEPQPATAGGSGQGSRQPAAVKPGGPATPSRRKTLPHDEYRPRPGETVCGRCGAGNASERKFCRRCGNELADAPVMAPLPWWRRLFRRERKVVVAGTRPSLRRRSKLPRRLLVAALLVGLVVVAMRFGAPLLGGAVDAVRDRISGPTRMEPTNLTSSSDAPGHEAAQARDGDPETYWAPGTRGDGKGEFIEATFDRPFRLVAIQVFNGGSRNDKKYLTTSRPADVLFTITRSNGSVELREVTLRDDPRQQDFLMGINDVVIVKMTIQSAFQSSPTKRVALGEIAFFTRS